MRSWAILTDGYLTERNAKTAHGVVRYAHDDIACIIDREHAGKTLVDAMPELGRDAPIVASVEEALAYSPTSLLLGVATPGGWMPEHWREWIIEAIGYGLEIVNGLHSFLRDDPELVRLAEQNSVALWDVRDPPRDIPLFSGRVLKIPKKVVLTVGSDCAVGKKTAAIELTRAGRKSGFSTEFVATGQTGILIAGQGIAVDRVISDFLPGAAEKLVCETHPATDVAVVEGQGSLWHPAYSAVTLGLIHGCCPHALVLCHQAGRVAIEEPPHTKLPSLTEMIDGYERLASYLRLSKVACIALNCQGLDESSAKSALANIENETGLPAGDPLAGDSDKLWAAVEEVLAPRR
ncbi:MAG: DUF1611 domain-containing protein [Actinomycetota bacterium]|nr:DUF1611 domain-containing protein [Actinomycetota bacterium]